MQRSAMWIALTVALLAAGASPAAAAKRLPWDLTPRAVGNPPAQAAPGSTIAVSWRVRRSGRASSRARLRFLLSRDSRRSRGDLSAGPRPRLRRLGRRRSQSGKTRIRLPGAARSGSYRVLACIVQPRRRRSDRRPRNDCRASRRAVRIVAGGTASPPAAQGAGPAAPGGVGPGRPGTPGSGFPRPANPRNVTPTLDTDGRVSQFVPRSGGELSTTDEEGNEYTLTLPDDALFNDTTITMTPVSSLAGAPGGLVGAVKLEPEGLVLNKPATLEISPVGTPPPASRQVAFTAEGNGKDFHPLPDPDGGLAVPLLHFSIPGVVDATSADVSSGMPARSQAQYEQLIRDAVKREDDSAIESLSAGYYRDVVQPKLQAALSSDAAMNAGLAAGLVYLRQLELAGRHDLYLAYFDRVYDLIGQILRNGANRAYGRCVNDHDLTAIRQMLLIERWAQLLGLSSDDQYADVINKARNCLRFELDLTSEVTTTLEDGGYTYKLHATDVAFFGFGDQGSGPLVWDTFSGGQSKDAVCDYHEPDPPDEPDSIAHSEVTVAGRENSTLKASLEADIAPRVEGAPQPDPLNSAFLAINSGSPIERYRLAITGDCGSSTGDVEQSLWEFWYGRVADGAQKVGPLTVFTRLERGTGDLLLSETVDYSGSALTDDTSIKILHRPLP